MRRQTPLRPGRPPHRTTAIRTQNRKRKASEFARCYHSRERVRFVKGLPCLVCNALSPFIGETTRGRSDNAHVETGGAGRKADYDRIIPLCRSHHTRYDEHRPPFDDEAARDAARGMAAVVEAAWQSHLRQTGRARQETDRNG